MRLPLALCLCAALALPASAVKTPPRPFYKGMTVSCPTWGRAWGTPEMGVALKELRALGVTAAAIHPYAPIRADGSVGAPYGGGTTAHLEGAARYAKEAGTDLFYKPHLGYWGSPFAWRGAIRFDDEAAWARFFTTYKAFIVAMARHAQRQEAPLFAVGTELEGTTHREAEWRGVIAAVRAVYKGQLTYAANWDALEKVPFWDALDLIGVQAYFPLSKGPLSAGSAPTRAQLEASWATVRQTLRATSHKHGGKPVLLTEIGYARSAQAASKPWEPALDGRPETLALRRLLLDVAFEQISLEPVLKGAFWWKWMPGHAPHDADFSMKDPEARAALRRWWSPRAPGPSLPMPSLIEEHVGQYEAGADGDHGRRDEDAR